MITERCIQNLKQIITYHGTENSPQQCFHDDIVTWFKQNMDESIQIPSVNRDSFKIKTMLWNLDNLKAHIRPKFESRLLSILHNDGVIKLYTNEQVPENMNPQPASGEKENVAGDEGSVFKKEEDWFDRMLNIVAAVVRGFMFNTT